MFCMRIMDVYFVLRKNKKLFKKKQQKNNYIIAEKIKHY